MGPKVGPRFLCLNCMKTLPKDHTYFCSKCNWPVCNLDCEKGKSHQKECATLSSHPKVRKLMTYNYFFFFKIVSIGKNSTDWQFFHVIHRQHILLHITTEQFYPCLFFTLPKNCDDIFLFLLFYIERWSQTLWRISKHRTFETFTK